MQKIYSQSWLSWWSHIDCYTIKQSIQKMTITMPLESVIRDARHESESIFLLDEGNFDLFTFPMEGTFYEAVTIDIIDGLIAKTIRQLTLERRIQWALLFYDIDHISIDGQKTAYILGQQWHLRRRLSLAFIKPRIALACPEIARHYTASLIAKKNSWPRVYPASFFTLQFIIHELEKQDFSIITISDDHTRLITIRDGYYQDIASLDRGYDHLKHICTSNNILTYLYKSNDDLESNPMAYRIMDETMEFYTKTLVRWIAEQSRPGQDCIIIAPMMTNKLFQEHFTKHYSQQINGYIVPFTTTQKLDNYGRTWLPHELDILTCLNFADGKTLIG